MFSGQVLAAREKLLFLDTPCGFGELPRLPGQGSHHHVHLLPSDQNLHDDHLGLPLATLKSPLHHQAQPTAVPPTASGPLPVLCALRGVSPCPASSYSTFRKALSCWPPREHSWACWLSICWVFGSRHTRLAHPQCGVWPLAEGPPGITRSSIPLAPPAVVRPPGAQPSSSHSGPHWSPRCESGVAPQPAPQPLASWTTHWQWLGHLGRRTLLPATEVACSPGQAHHTFYNRRASGTSLTSWKPTAGRLSQGVGT